MTLKKGQYVRHAKYGWGTIVEHDDRETMVYFRTIGLKKLPAALALFANVEGTSRPKKSST
jgi:phosphosulfolactate synthase (CoM biosynthesis protein A)